MSQLKAIFLIPNLSPGGIQTQVFYLATYLKIHYQIEVQVYGFVAMQAEFTDRLEEGGIKWAFKPKFGNLIWNYDSLSILQRVRLWASLWFFLMRHPRSVILPYTKNLDTFFNALVSLTWVKRSFSFERGGHFEPKKEADSRINRLRRSAQPIYVSNSRHGKLAIQTIKGIQPENIYIVPNGIDIDKFQYKPRKERSPVVITMVANYFPEKEHQFVIHAISRVSEETRSGIRIQFVGLGSGSMCFDNFEKAKCLVNELNLNDCIEFLGSSSNINDILSGSDIGLLASRSEGCPNAILEYMASGLPILASQIPGIEELMTEENSPFLFETGNFKDFEVKLEKLIGNANLRSELGLLNLKHVRSNYSVTKMGEAYHRILVENWLV